MDTLRADHLGAWGYERPTSPAIDAFAADAVRFDRAYAPSTWTKPSVASMLTGVHPRTHGVLELDHALPADAVTMAERLRAAGWATGAVVSHHLISRAFGYEQGFERFRDDQGRGHRYVSSPAVTRQAIEMIDALAAGERPFFLLVHYFDPHFMYLRHDDVRFAGDAPERIDVDRSFGELQDMEPPLDAGEIGHLVATYDEEIRFTDRWIGELLDALRARGLYDDAFIALTADHGEAFFEHGTIGHSTDLHDEQARVPLLVRWPRGEAAGSVVASPVSIVALAATTAEAAGLDADADAFQEASLRALVRGERAPAPVFLEIDYERLGAKTKPRERFGTTHQAALVDGPFKLLLDKTSGSAALYDLAADPGEQRDVAAAHGDVAQALGRALAERMQQLPRASAPAPSQPLSDEEREMLRGLGYIE